nr:serine protease [Alloyangia pacifica]
MESREDGRGWEAVGRLEIGGTAFCTGALIAPELVLTAAHCLFDAQSGARVPVEDIQFLAGWRNGRAAAYRRVRHDLAVIELQLPIRNHAIAPFALGPFPEAGEELGVVSYAHDRSEAPALQEYCGVLDRQEGMLVLDCTVDFGSSGAPVFSFEGGAPRIVSVISAKAEAGGAPVSLATGVSGPLAELRGALEADIVRNPLGAGRRRDTGAKFIKP